MKNKRYCLVIELKKENVEDYKKLHKNPWQEMLDAIKSTGTKELLIWSYENFSIIYYECDDINRFYRELKKLDVVKKWDEKAAPWIKKFPTEESGNIVPLEKIFDLNQQLSGKLEKY